MRMMTFQNPALTPEKLEAMFQRGLTRYAIFQDEYIDIVTDEEEIHEQNYELLFRMSNFFDFSRYNKPFTSTNRSGFFTKFHSYTYEEYIVAHRVLSAIWGFEIPKVKNAKRLFGKELDKTVPRQKLFPDMGKLDNDYDQYRESFWDHVTLDPPKDESRNWDRAEKDFVRSNLSFQHHIHDKYRNDTIRSIFFAKEYGAFNAEYGGKDIVEKEKQDQVNLKYDCNYFCASKPFSNRMDMNDMLAIQFYLSYIESVKKSLDGKMRFYIWGYDPDNNFELIPMVCVYSDADIAPVDISMMNPLDFEKMRKEEIEKREFFEKNNLAIGDDFFAGREDRVLDPDDIKGYFGKQNEFRLTAYYDCHSPTYYHLFFDPSYYFNHQSMKTVFYGHRNLEENNKQIIYNMTVNGILLGLDNAFFRSFFIPEISNQSYKNKFENSKITSQMVFDDSPACAADLGLDLAD
jgi:hypothetical protein